VELLVAERPRHRADGTATAGKRLETKQLADGDDTVRSKTVRTRDETNGRDREIAEENGRDLTGQMYHPLDVTVTLDTGINCKGRRFDAK